MVCILDLAAKWPGTIKSHCHHLTSDPFLQWLSLVRVSVLVLVVLLQSAGHHASQVVVADAMHMTRHSNSRGSM